MMDVWSGLAGWLAGYSAQVGREQRCAVVCVLVRSATWWWCLVALLWEGIWRMQVQVQVQVQVAGSGLDSGSGWRGRWMKEKADGWMGTDGPSALNRIKWQTDETQQELLGSQAVQVCRGPAGWQADGG